MSGEAPDTGAAVTPPGITRKVRILHFMNLISRVVCFFFFFWFDKESFMLSLCIQFTLSLGCDTSPSSPCTRSVLSQKVKRSCSKPHLLVGLKNLFHEFIFRYPHFRLFKQIKTNIHDGLYQSDFIALILLL